jgi:hypothetical protein
VVAAAVLLVTLVGGYLAKQMLSEWGCCLHEQRCWHTTLQQQWEMTSLLYW